MEMRCRVLETARFRERLGKTQPRGKRFDAPLRSPRQLLRDGEGIRKVIDRLVIGGAFERPFSGLLPIRQRQIVTPSLGIVTRKQLRLGGDNVRMRFDDRVGDRLVVLAPLAAQQRLVGGILDQGMAEEQGLVRHPAYHHELGRQKFAQRTVEHRPAECDDLRQQAAIEFPTDDGGDLRDLLRGSRQAGRAGP